MDRELGGVVAPGLDVVADARLAAAHGDSHDLNGLAAEGLVVVAAARGAPAGDVAPPSIARVVVAPAPDAQRVRDVQVAAPPRWLVVAQSPMPIAAMLKQAVSKLLL